MPILKRQVSSSLNFVLLFSFMKDNFYVLFSSNIYTLLKRSPLKSRFWRLLSAQVKICQIPLQILYPSSVSWKITPLYFLAQTIYTLLKRSTLKWKFLRLSSAWVTFPWKIRLCHNIRRGKVFVIQPKFPQRSFPW